VLLEWKIKNLTAEVAEHAEEKIFKGSRRKDKNGVIPKASRKVKTPRKLSEKDLCVLRFLFVDPLVLMRGGSGEERA